MRFTPCVLLLAIGCWAQGTSVVQTVHNLSAFGPGEVKVLGEKEVCKFCHVPHSGSAPVPLWGRPVPQGQFRVPEISVGNGKVPAPQPDGASRLCLSCHDGSVAQGFLPATKALTSSSRGSRERGDLSGSHPVSVPLPEHALDPAGDRDIVVKPRAVIAADPAVRLDKDGKIQCTTCHDPHADPYYQPGVVPHFWVRPTVDEVCLTCHELQ